MLGFDVLHTVPSPDEELAAISSRQSRMLLTRDVGLLKRKEVRRGYFVRATDRHTQLSEIVKRFCLLDSIVPFTRCLVCNTPLEHTDKAAIAQQLAERTAVLHNDFMRCTTCGRVYWKRSHYDRMRSLMMTLTRDASQAEPNMIEKGGDARSAGQRHL